MTLTATAQPADGVHAPRVRLDLDAGAGNTFESLSIARNGRPLSRSVAPDGVSETFAYDYEAPFGRLVTYVATGTTSAGSYSSTTTVLLDEPSPWLIHPVLPGLSVRIDSADKSGIFVTSDTRQEISRGIERAIFSPPGRDRAVAYPMGVRQLPEWNLDLATPTIADRDSLLALLADGASLLLRIPEGYGDGTWDVPDGWCSVGAVPERRVGASAYRTLSLTMTPTAEPPVQLAPPFTWGDLALGYTWGDLLGHTWLDVLAGEV